jgi:hypothetical protein
VNGNPLDETLAPQDKADPCELQMRNFLDAIGGAATPINSAQQAIRRRSRGHKKIFQSHPRR